MANLERGGSLTGLSESEAKEFHGIFLTSFIGFIIVAAVAHFLAWSWHPWAPVGGISKVASLIDSATTVLSSVV